MSFHISFLTECLKARLQVQGKLPSCLVHLGGWIAAQSDNDGMKGNGFKPKEGKFFT